MQPFQRSRTLVVRSVTLSLLALAASAQNPGEPFTQRGVIGIPISPDATTLPFPASPAGNPFHGPSASAADRKQTLAIARLGKALFWDEQVSSDNTMACGTCHFPEAGGIDPRAGRIAPNGVLGSEGMHPQSALQDFLSDPTFLDGDPPTKRVTGFNAPTMINAAFSVRLFWLATAGPGLETANGSGVLIPGFEEFAALESLAVVPPVSDIEMAHDGLTWESGALQAKLGESPVLRYATPATVPVELQSMLGKKYSQVFAQTFGPSVGPPVTRTRFAMALAHYMRTLVSDKAPVDLPEGQGGLTKKMEKGFEILLANGCLNCHTASAQPVLARNAAGELIGGFENIMDGPLSRGGDILLPVGLPGTAHDISVKTPSLRNLALKPRFFHNGLIMDPDELIDFYEGDLDDMPPPIPSTRFQTPLTAQDRAAVKAFLFEGLTDARVANALPPFDRPDLHSERLRALGPDENIILPGTGSTGPLGPPSIIANSPLAFDRNEWKVGLEGGFPNGFGILLLSLSPSDQAPGLQIASIFQPLDPDGMGTVRIAQIAPGALVGTTWYGRWLTYHVTNGTFETAWSDEAAFLVQ